VDFCRFHAGEGIGEDSYLVITIIGGEVTKLFALVVNFSARTNINDEGKKDDDPSFVS
jgi:hypothetical protein